MIPTYVLDEARRRLTDIGNPDEPEFDSYPADDLPALIASLGIDLAAASNPHPTWQEVRDAAPATETRYAFRGEVRFDLIVELMGVRAVHPARAIYRRNPDWEYIDPQTMRPMLQSERTPHQIDVLLWETYYHVDGDGSRNWRVRRPSAPEWLPTSLHEPVGLLPAEGLAGIDELVDLDMRAADARRRARLRQFHGTSPLVN